MPETQCIDFFPLQNSDRADTSQINPVTEKNKKFLMDFKENYLKDYQHLTNPKKALVFSYDEDFKKEGVRLFATLFKYPTNTLNDIFALFEELCNVPYRAILLDVDSIFPTLHAMLSFIRYYYKNSKNKKTLIYLFSNNIQNIYQLERTSFDKKIILLTDLKEIAEISKNTFK